MIRRSIIAVAAVIVVSAAAASTQAFAGDPAFAPCRYEPATASPVLASLQAATLAR